MLWNTADEQDADARYPSLVLVPTKIMLHPNTSMFCTVVKSYTEHDIARLMQSLF